MLEAADVGVEDLAGSDATRQMVGMHVVFVFGRAVTNVLQGLRSTEVGGRFDEWYEPWQREMREDKLLRFFYKRRSAVLKEGDAGPVSHFHVNLTRAAAQQLSDRSEHPAGDLRLEISEAGVTWVHLESGKATLPAPLPEGITVDTRPRFLDPPKRHLGQKLKTNDAHAICSLYVRYLGRLLDAAAEEFAGGDSIVLGEGGFQIE